MIRVRHAVTVALAALLLAACNKDKVVGPKPNEITGTWNATKVEFVKKSAPATRADLIALGAAVTVRIDSDKSYRYIETPAAGSPDTTTGVWSLDGEIFRVTPTGMPFSWEWSASLSANTLSLTGAAMEYDFDGNNVPEEALQNMTLVR